jgi:hypothetical protein
VAHLDECSVRAKVREAEARLTVRLTADEIEEIRERFS